MLFFIAAKMFAGAAEHLLHLEIPWWSQLTPGTQANYSMVVVLAMLSMGVLASIFWPGEDEESSEARGRAA